MTGKRTDKIRSRLESAFSPTELKIHDDSHLHAGHAGASDGRGHFRVELVSEKFSGSRPLERHRMVFAALGEMMETDIHALSIQARTPDESGDPASKSTNLTKE